MHNIHLRTSQIKLTAFLTVIFYLPQKYYINNHIAKKVKYCKSTVSQTCISIWEKAFGLSSTAQIERWGGI